MGYTVDPFGFEAAAEFEGLVDTAVVHIQREHPVDDFDPVAAALTLRRDEAEPQREIGRRHWN